MTKHFMRCLAGCAALFVTASVLPAATVEIPGQQATIQDAIGAAAPGDTILITDSSTYAIDTTILLDKQISLEASPGENPTITNAGALDTGDAFFFPLDPAAASGTRIGSIEGGRINFVFNPTVPDWNDPPRAYLFPRLLGSSNDFTSLTLENLFITQETGGNIDNSYNITLLRDDPADGGTTRTFTVSHVEYNDNGNKASETLRQNNTLGFHNVDNSYFHGYSGGGYPLYARQGIVFNITNSAFDNRDSDAQLAQIFTPDEPRFPTFNVDSSIMIGGTDGVFERASAMGILNLTNSVFIAHDAPVYRTTDQDNPDHMNADHCDFIVINDAGEDIGVISPSDTTANDFTITNSNIIGVGATPGGSTTPAVNVVAASGDTAVFDHNNAYAPDWAGGLYDGSVTPTDSLSLDPEYSEDLLIGDATYSNTTLKTADDAGGPIGTDTSFAHLMPQPPPPVNPARDWWLY